MPGASTNPSSKSYKFKLLSRQHWPLHCSKEDESWRASSQVFSAAIVNPIFVHVSGFGNKKHCNRILERIIFFCCSDGHFENFVLKKGRMYEWVVSRGRLILSNENEGTFGRSSPMRFLPLKFGLIPPGVIWLCRVNALLLSLPPSQDNCSKKTSFRRQPRMLTQPTPSKSRCPPPAVANF